MSETKKKILVVDDEASFTRLLQLNLEQTGEYEVQVVNVSTLAVAQAERFQPDLILLDVMMPGLSGGDLAEHFQKRGSLRNIPIVFLTAAVKKDEVSLHGGLIGGLPFLAKPVDTTELIACLKKHLHATE
jgi:CheY-like chemotaxis protein